MDNTPRMRLDEVIAHLRRQPGGMTSSELAEALDVDASTIRRDLARLVTTDVGLRRRGRRYTLDFRRGQRPLRLSADEVLALYLACRLLTRQLGERNPHAESAMHKLADAVRDDAPRLARYVDDAVALAHLLPLHEGFQRSLEMLTQAISEGRVVAFGYHDQHGVASERRLRPYALEPYAETSGYYVIGFDEVREAIRNFRVDRIEAVTLTDDRFDLPMSFNPSRLFSEAWGVAWTGAEPQLVELCFRDDGSARVQEAVWHPSQRVTPQPDGSCLVTFRVSAPAEMRRWILQWGADVEVLSPPDLREVIVAESHRMGSRYPAAPADAAPT